MAESDNVALVGRIYEAFGRGDIAYILDQLTDDVRWVTPPRADRALVR
jgi:ketosteroid isomerase-like protein